ncbi:MAG: TlyA family RNA methyltransferase [Sneathiella sp.]
MSTERLDIELVSRGFTDSRAKAQAFIKEKRVSVNGVIAKKASQKTSDDADIEVENRGREWVGRGAFKLLAALEHFKYDPAGKIAADIGASTGGFSEVLLSQDIAKVYAVDVGHGQLHSSLLDEPKLINLEGLNAKALELEHIPEPLDLIVSDVSFISIKKALPAVLSLCKPGACLFTLVKPQFEVGKQNIGKGGIVRDPMLVEAVRVDIEEWINSQAGWQSLGIIDSPITGSDGNREFLLGAKYNA